MPFCELEDFLSYLRFYCFSIFFALIRTASVPSNLITVPLVFLVFSCHTIICHKDILWSVLLFHRLHLSLPVPQSFPILLHWLQITPLSLGREQHLFPGNIKHPFPGNQPLARLSHLGVAGWFVVF